MTFGRSCISVCLFVHLCKHEYSMSKKGPKVFQDPLRIKLLSLKRIGNHYLNPLHKYPSTWFSTWSRFSTQPFRVVCGFFQNSSKYGLESLRKNHPRSSFRLQSQVLRVIIGLKPASNFLINFKYGLTHPYQNEDSHYKNNIY